MIDKLIEETNNKLNYQRENIPNKKWSKSFKSGYMSATEEIYQEILQDLKQLEEPTIK